ncbi:MAG: type II secretion system protein GspG [Planctomycetota bacterium]
MSQQAASYPPYVMVPVRESNGLGVAGFFIALIGLFIPTGIIALLGLLISLAALGRPPRGFAAMGVVIGLFGTVLWLVITGVVVVGGLAAGVVAVLAVAAMFIMTQPEIIEVTSDMFNVTIAAVEYEERNGDLPDDLGALGLAVSTLTDPWGNPYSYRLANHDPGFDVMSNGADGLAGTDDDMALSRINVIWEDAFDGFGEKMEEFGQRMEALEGRKIRIEGASYSEKSCDKPCPPKPATPAERYEAAAVAAAIADEVAQEVAATAAPAPPDPPKEPPAPEEPDAKPDAPHGH